jgi:hypothetical protein
VRSSMRPASAPADSSCSDGIISRCPGLALVERRRHAGVHRTPC